MSTVKLKLKKGDQVRVIAGKNKYSAKNVSNGMVCEGDVIELLVDKQKVIVKGVNLLKKHKKPTNDNAGGIVEVEAPIHISNVQLLDAKSGQPTKVGRRIENDKIVRYSKKSNQTIK